MYVPVQQPIPSPQAMELGHRIASLVRAHLAENPGIGSADVAQAFTVARELLRSELGSATSRTLILLMAGLVALGVVGAVMLLSATGNLDPRLPSIVIAVAVLAIVAAVAVMSKQAR